ncbi:hypothetical protein GGR50DRAFT_658638 [Xylaria sp. CBS 124048]|nr:hypothetical protein GGR50DRAFT_658638 [Xylaria sp. CBS 124048]
MDDANVNRARRRQTITALLDAYGSLSVQQLLACLAPAGFHHQILPESLGMPVRDRAGFEKHAVGIFSVFSAFEIRAKRIVDDGEAVVVNAQMLGTLKLGGGGGGGNWKNECVMMIRLTEDGMHVLDIKEFVDSAKALEMARNHAPEDFGGSGSGDGDGEDEGASSWEWLLDPELLLHVGAFVVVLFGLQQLAVKGDVVRRWYTG